LNASADPPGGIGMWFWDFLGDALGKIFILLLSTVVGTVAAATFCLLVSMDLPNMLADAAHHKVEWGFAFVAFAAATLYTVVWLDERLRAARQRANPPR
jgi:hypothetical protein